MTSIVTVGGSYVKEIGCISLVWCVGGEEKGGDCFWRLALKAWCGEALRRNAAGTALCSVRTGELHPNRNREDEGQYVVIF